MAWARISVAGMHEVVRGLEEGLETLTEVQSTLRSTMERYEVSSLRTWGIGPAIDWARTELPGARRRLARAEALEGDEPHWPAGTVRFDDVDGISSMDPDAARRAGREAAVALLEGRGVPDDELIYQILELGEDPYFASGFARALTPEELASVVLRLSDLNADVDAVDLGIEEEAPDWYGRLLTGLSTTLATATRATGDLALPPRYAQRWVDEITRPVPGMHLINADGHYVDHDADGQMDHSNALGVLLTSGRFSSAFLETVGSGLLGYEQVYGQGVWEQQVRDLLHYQGVRDVDGHHLRDPLVGFLTALGNNPIAAQEFLTGERNSPVQVGGEEVQVSQRLKYLLQERDWHGDGSALGAALQAATITFRDRDTTGWRSASIASQVFALLGERTGEDPSGGLFGIGAHDGWQVPHGLRGHLAEMLASYGTDVHRVVVVGSDDLTQGWSRPDSGSLFPQDMPYGAVMDRALLEQLVQTLGQDQEHFTPFLAGMFQAGNLAVDTGLQRAMEQQTETHAGAIFITGGLSDHSNAAIINAATVVGWALNTGYGGAVADEAMQQKRAEAIANALSVASMVPLIPTIEHEWGKWAADQSKKWTLDEIRGSAPDDSTGDYLSLDESSRQQLRDMTANLLLQNGYFSDEAIAAAAEERGVVFIAPPPEAISTRATGELVFLTDSDEYRMWLRQSAINEFLESSVVGVYADQWGVVDP